MKMMLLLLLLLFLLRLLTGFSDTYTRRVDARVTRGIVRSLLHLLLLVVMCVPATCHPLLLVLLFETHSFHVCVTTT